MTGAVEDLGVLLAEDPPADGGGGRGGGLGLVVDDFGGGGTRPVEGRGRWAGLPAKPVGTFEPANTEIDLKMWWVFSFQPL